MTKGRRAPSRHRIATAVGFLAIGILAGCRAEADRSSETPVLAGRVMFAKTPERAGRYPHLQNADGSVRNAFVYVKIGLEGRSFGVPDKPVVLDQRDFQFVPRVFGVQVGQTVHFKTSDYAMHNVHCVPFDNPEFSESMLPGEEFKKVFRTPETMILFRCEHHLWMRAYMGVLPHPFFDVTGEEGKFEIPGLPPGRYVLEAWEERLGATRVDVTIEPGRRREIEIVYR